MFINKIMTPLQMKILCLLTMSFCLSGCISRLSRPEITGQVINMLGQPIENAQVGETLTNMNGNFRLKERRRYAFLLNEIMYMEAPPVLVQEAVSKTGYQTCYLQYFSRYGGGQAKGAKLTLGEISLYRHDEVENSDGIKDCTIKFQEK